MFEGFTFFEKLRSDYPNMSASTLIFSGIVIGAIVAWLYWKREVSHLKNRVEHLKEALAGHAPSDAALAALAVRRPKVGPTIVFICLVGAVIGAAVWLVEQNAPSLKSAAKQNGDAKAPTGITTPGIGYPPKADSDVMQWNPTLGTQRSDVMIAVFLDGRGPDTRSLKMTDAFIEGLTGEVIKMRVAGDDNSAEQTFPVSEAGRIPANGFIRLVAVFNPTDRNKGVPNKEFLERWGKIWFNATYEDAKPDRILFDMVPYFPGLTGPRVTRTPNEKKN
jgi:hypothetical protein